MTDAFPPSRPDLVEVERQLQASRRPLNDYERKIVEAMLDARDKASLAVRLIEKRRKMLALLADVEQRVRNAGFGFDDADATYVIDEMEANPQILAGFLADNLLTAKRKAPKDPSAAPT